MRLSVRPCFVTLCFGPLFGEKVVPLFEEDRHRTHTIFEVRTSFLYTISPCGTTRLHLLLKVESRRLTYSFIISIAQLRFATEQEHPKYHQIVKSPSNSNRQKVAKKCKFDQFWSKSGPKSGNPKRAESPVNVQLFGFRKNRVLKKLKFGDF